MTRIAIIGAGAAGLSAALALRNLGYKHVAVYEQNAKAGGRAESNTDLGKVVELGATFVMETATTTRQLADQFGVSYTELLVSLLVVDDDGAVLTPEEFVLRKHGLAALEASIPKYSALIDKYNLRNRRNMAGLPPELKRPFAEFIQSQGIEPVADLYRAAAVGFGYPYYEDVPAAYLLRSLGSSIQVGPDGPYIPKAYFFPNGFQQLFIKIADDLGSQDDDGDGIVDRGFIANAKVTEIVRRHKGAATTVMITANGHQREYDFVIITTPPKATMRFLDVTEEEKSLLSQAVSRNYHVNVPVVSGIPDAKMHVVLYPNTRPANIGHLNLWTQLTARPTGERVLATFQNVSWSQSSAEALQWMADDIRTWGGGTLISNLLHKEWDNFQHFETAALERGVYEQLESMQGRNGTFLAGGLMTLDAIEPAINYARDLVTAHFGR